MGTTSSGLAILSSSLLNPSIHTKQKKKKKKTQHPATPDSNLLPDQDLFVPNILGHWLITFVSQYCGLPCYEKLSL